MPETPRKIRCRVQDKYSNLCSGEAVDPEAELIICSRHLAAAFRMLNTVKANVAAGKAAR